MRTIGVPILSLAAPNSRGYHLIEVPITSYKKFNIIMLLQ